MLSVIEPNQILPCPGSQVNVLRGQVDMAASGGKPLSWDNHLFEMPRDNTARASTFRCVSSGRPPGWSHSIPGCRFAG